MITKKSYCVAQGIVDIDVLISASPITVDRVREYLGAGEASDEEISDSIEDIDNLVLWLLEYGIPQKGITNLDD